MYTVTIEKDMKRGRRESGYHSVAWTCEREKVQCTVQELQPDQDHHCGRAMSGTAARTALVYSEYIVAYIQGLYNTVQVLGGCRCVRRDSSDQKYASTDKHFLNNTFQICGVNRGVLFSSHKGA
jgi:hypothetical protein